MIQVLVGDNDASEALRRQTGIGQPLQRRAGGIDERHFLAVVQRK
jgi:hypothetical protein